MAYQASIARFGQDCPACQRWIAPGDVIATDDEDGKGWRHDACLPRPAANRPPPPYPESLARTWDRDGRR